MENFIKIIAVILLCSVWQNNFAQSVKEIRVIGGLLGSVPNNAQTTFTAVYTSWLMLTFLVKCCKELLNQKTILTLELLTVNDQFIILYFLTLDLKML